MKLRIKTLKIIPDDIGRFLTYLDQLEREGLSPQIRSFISECLDVEADNVDDCDDFYIDRPYRFNLYNYSQKFDARLRLKARRLGFTGEETELNWFTSEPNLLYNGKYLKPKGKPNYNEYYDYLTDKFNWFEVKDDFLIVDATRNWKLDSLVLDDSVINQFVDYLVEMYNKGLWLNNFNNYSIRYNGQFHCYDPDIFYVIKHNNDIKNIESEEDFLRTYAHYKLRDKNIVYRVNDPYSVNVEVLEYIYYSYWFLENVSQVVYTKL